MFCVYDIEVNGSMMYPYLTFDDETEVTHSHIIEEDGERKVYVHFERPIEDDNRAFDEAECVLPTYEWIKAEGFSDKEMDMFNEFMRSNAHLFYKFAERGGIGIA